MQIQKEVLSPTKVKLTVLSDEPELDKIKQVVIGRLGKDVRLPGFREGKAPATLVEKQLGESLQSEFLNDAINQLLDQAVRKEGLRVVQAPKVNLSKFVPYTTLEFSAECDIIGSVKLPDISKISMTKPKVSVAPDEISRVLDNLRAQTATRTEVNRPIKSGDEATIDFSGQNAKTKEDIAGGKGSDYALVIGSGTFIPGFEEQLIGVKAGEEKTFSLTFPKDYGAKQLQNVKVNFTVTVKKVSETKNVKLDDAFAASVSPHKTLADLKKDIRENMKVQKQREADQQYDNDLVDKIADKSEVAIPDSIISAEMERIEEEEKRNIVYRGQTWAEHLKEEGVTEEQHKERQRPLAERRVKTGIVLGEIANDQKITVSRQELDQRIELLKQEYRDEKMRAELDTPDNQKDILNRMLVEKTLDKLRQQVSKTPVN
jgi:trigger factor